MSVFRRKCGHWPATKLHTYIYICMYVDLYILVYTNIYIVHTYIRVLLTRTRIKNHFEVAKKLNIFYRNKIV